MVSPSIIQILNKWGLSVILWLHLTPVGCTLWVYLEIMTPPPERPPRPVWVRVRGGYHERKVIQASTAATQATARTFPYDTHGGTVPAAPK